VLWDQIESDPDKAALAIALIERVPLLGWRDAALSAASEAAFSDATTWRQIFPRGPLDAIWYISEVSDASMRMSFSSSPAPSMSMVIITRLDQNDHMKPFVRKVMQFDIFHPVQAFSRMQRTSRVMLTCLGTCTPTPPLRTITVLNVMYTAIVFVWLFDRTAGNALTKRITREIMRLIGMS
jgi:hypothetical protein